MAAEKHPVLPVTVRYMTATGLTEPRTKERTFSERDHLRRWLIKHRFTLPDRPGADGVYVSRPTRPW